MTGGQRVFAGLVAGAAAGLALARFAPDWIATVDMVAKPLGTLWLLSKTLGVIFGPRT